MLLPGEATTGQGDLRLGEAGRKDGKVKQGRNLTSGDG